MAWRTVQSKNGPRRYFYLSVRVKGRVKTEYYAWGPWREQFIQEIEQRLEARREAAELVKQKRAARLIHKQIGLVIQAGMVAEGYYLHGRGTWRVRRFTMQHELDPLLPVPTSLPELVAKANKGSPQALAELRGFLQAHPEVWPPASDLAKQTLEACINRLAKGDVVLAESIRLRADELRRRLQLPHASLVENLALDSLVLSWTEQYYLQLQYGAENRPQLQGKTSLLINAACQRYSIAMRLYGFLKENRKATTCPTPASQRDWNQA